MNVRDLLRRAASPAGILALAVLVRTAFVLSMGDRMYFADTAEYEAAAIRLLHGQPSAAGDPRAPLYPAFMALGFAIGGEHDYRTTRLLQVLLSTLIVWGSGRVARSIGGEAAERPALWLTALSPLLVFASGLLYPTTLHALLLLGFTAAVLRVGEHRSLMPAIAAGLALAAGLATDLVFAAPAGALTLWAVARSRRIGWTAVRGVAVMMLVATGLLLPWVLSHRPAAGGGGAFMQKAQYVLDWSRSDPRVASRRRVRLPADTQFRPLSARAFAAREFGLLRQQPAAYLGDVASEFMHFFAPVPDRIQTRNRYNRASILWVGALHFIPLLVLGALGAWRGAGATALRVALSLVVLATAGFYAFFFTQTRYRIPVEPMMAVLAALALVRFAPRLTHWLAGGDTARSGPATRPVDR